MAFAEHSPGASSGAGCSSSYALSSSCPQHKLEVPENSLPDGKIAPNQPKAESELKQNSKASTCNIIAVSKPENDNVEDGPETLDPSALWDVRYNELKDFVKVNGHADVPAKFPENPPLSNWVRRQRQRYMLQFAVSSMTQSRTVLVVPRTLTAIYSRTHKLSCSPDSLYYNLCSILAKTGTTQNR